MKYRFLIGAGVALATVFGVAQAQAQIIVGPTGPGVWYFARSAGIVAYLLLSSSVLL